MARFVLRISLHGLLQESGSQWTQRAHSSKHCTAYTSAIDLKMQELEQQSFHRNDSIFSSFFLVDFALRLSQGAVIGTVVGASLFVIIIIGMCLLLFFRRKMSGLHTFSERSVIHRDVKSSNILLDHSMCAKVADFGFSKYAPQEGDSATSLEVRGTAGYLDLESLDISTFRRTEDLFNVGFCPMERQFLMRRFHHLPIERIQKSIKRNAQIARIFHRWMQMYTTT